LPNCLGVASNAALMPARALGVCIRASSASNSPLSVSSLLSAARARALNSSRETRTAFGASCLVMTTTRPRMTISRSRPNSFLATVDVTEAASTRSARWLRTAARASGRLRGRAFMVMASSKSHFSHNAQSRQYARRPPSPGQRAHEGEVPDLAQRQHVGLALLVHGVLVRDDGHRRGDQRPLAAAAVEIVAGGIEVAPVIHV